MKKRRRSTRSRYEPTIWDVMEWRVDVNIMKEIVGLVFLLTGFVFFLSLFQLAGPLGIVTLRLFEKMWGFYGFVFPIAILLLGINLLRHTKDETVRASVTIGMIAAFVFIPAIIPGIGGKMGMMVSAKVAAILGPVAGTLVVFILSVISIMIAFNIKVTDIYARWATAKQDDGEDESGKPATNIKVNEPTKAPVFMTNQAKQQPPQQKPAQTQLGFLEKAQKANATWELPPIDLLDVSTTHAVSGNIHKNAETIQKTLKNFNIEVEMSEANVGPTVTQYTLKPADGVKLNQITARSNDLALALAAKSLRVEAPIPGKEAVGIEIPNQKAATVTLREILESKDFEQSKSNLSLALGLDVAGIAMAVDLKKMPHLLIAGSTGSGKSVCINSIIVTLLYQNSPADMRLLMVDPKRVEFTEYNGIPHLLAPVITEVDKTVNALKWAVKEMERRFEVFASQSRRNIEAFNENPPEGQKMPYIVIVIDELADLMAQAANDVEGSIVRIAQMARAVGIHLIVATQRPSVDVITGLIKANMPCRIAFAVASQIDSRTIIDQSGADKLLGKGDMLYLSADLGKPKRVQGVNIGDKEIKDVTDFLKREGEAIYDESITSFKTGGSGQIDQGDDGGFEDDLYGEAKKLVIQVGKASASLLQRRLRIGYARAARLLDLLEADGIIGPADGSKPRDVIASSSQDTNYNYDQYNDGQY